MSSAASNHGIPTNFHLPALSCVKSFVYLASEFLFYIFMNISKFDFSNIVTHYNREIFS